MCIELSASSENAFKLYNFLNKGERKIFADGQWIIINENDKCPGYNTKYYSFF